jgi:hypothetical protein
METMKPDSATVAFGRPTVDHFRFHRPHVHLASAFGNDTFALKAEAFARFFGTPVFLGTQTAIVAIWIAVNVTRPYEVRRLSIYSAQSGIQSPGSLCSAANPAGADATGSARHRARRG